MTDSEKQKRDNMSSEEIDTLTDLVKELHVKIDKLLDGKSGKKATPATKVKQYVTPTAKFLESEEPLCAYMQKNDCDGHCGKPAKFSVIKGEPIEFSDLNVKTAADPNKEKLRKAFFRCTTCKNKGKDKSSSRCYSKIYNFLYGTEDEDDAIVEDGLEDIIGSPDKKKKLKKDSKKETKKKEKKEKKEESGDEGEDPNFEVGLDDPQEKNPHLKSTERFNDKLVKVGKKFAILRCYTDKRKKDVCIGVLKNEPEDEDYEDHLKEPKQSLLDEMNVKYKTPEEAARETPPKAKKTERKREVIEDSDGDDDDGSGGDDGDEDDNKAFDKMINGEDSD